MDVFSHPELEVITSFMRGWIPNRISYKAISPGAGNADTDAATAVTDV